MAASGSNSCSDLCAVRDSEPRGAAAGVENMGAALEERGGIAQADGEIVVARPRTDHVEMEVEFVAGEEELREFVAGLPPGASVVYGRFPAVDDGMRAVTLDLPDRDGIVRPHPH